MGNQTTKQLIPVKPACPPQTAVHESGLESCERIVSVMRRIGVELNAWAEKIKCDQKADKLPCAQLIDAYMEGSGETSAPASYFSEVAKRNVTSLLDLIDLTSTSLIATKITFEAALWPIGFQQGEEGRIADITISGVGLSFVEDKLVKRPTFINVINTYPEGGELRLVDAIELALSVFFVKRALALSDISQEAKDFFGVTEQLLIVYVDPTTTQAICYKINDSMQWVQTPFASARGKAIDSYIRQCTIKQAESCARGAPEKMRTDIRDLLTELETD